VLFAMRFMIDVGVVRAALSACNCQLPKPRRSMPTQAGDQAGLRGPPFEDSYFPIYTDSSKL
jgi:hypothetical protein